MHPMRDGVVFAPSQYNVFRENGRYKTIYPTASLESIHEREAIRSI